MDWSIISIALAGCFTLGASLITVLNSRVDSIKDNAELVDVLSKIMVSDEEKHLVEELRKRTFRKLERKLHPFYFRLLFLLLFMFVALIALLVIFAITRAEWVQILILLICACFVVTDIGIIWNDTKRNRASTHPRRKAARKKEAQESPTQ